MQKRRTSESFENGFLFIRIRCRLSVGFYASDRSKLALELLLDGGLFGAYH
jgi:hypothetical protein